VISEVLSLLRVIRPHDSFCRFCVGRPTCATLLAIRVWRAISAVVGVRTVQCTMSAWVGVASGRNGCVSRSCSKLCHFGLVDPLRCRSRSTGGMTAMKWDVDEGRKYAAVCTEYSDFCYPFSACNGECSMSDLRCSLQETLSKPLLWWKRLSQHRDAVPPQIHSRYLDTVGIVFPLSRHLSAPS